MQFHLNFPTFLYILTKASCAASSASSRLFKSRIAVVYAFCWYFSTSGYPAADFGLRNASDGNVVIENVDTGEILGQVDKFDAPPILHPDAIYMILGEEEHGPIDL